MKATIEIDSESPERIIRSIKPDMDETDKFEVSMEAKDNKVILKISAKDFSGLLAGINSYVRLIKVSMEAC